MYCIMCLVLKSESAIISTYKVYISVLQVIPIKVNLLDENIFAVFHYRDLK